MSIPTEYVRTKRQKTGRVFGEPTLVAERLRDLTDVVDLQRVHGDLLGAVVDQVELSAFVQGASKLSFPLGGIRFIKSLLELPRLHSPSLMGGRWRDGFILSFRCG